MKIPRRKRLPAGSRIPVTVNLSKQSLKTLATIAAGNRSAAIEQLVAMWREQKTNTTDAA